ncbi:TldD/PmbA family protein [Aureimonas fodinaquatilis]|uniref:TldD/PmbA family protein n=1 Tax=Aureimonas fodinaquatilis TaxID=2565783 RepID=A0A5B0E383_9HYPH|nr:TldD/PmbA family protein [Aureimonas fodinaquatilis]KAA0972210.1 TldD/PmbA family protein [Aureimonas fodinaquatilis]
MTNRTQDLFTIGKNLVAAAMRAGADAADAAIARSSSRSVQVRLGKVEQTDSSESDSVSLRVFYGGRVASVSADFSADPERLAERAVAMARVSPVDPYAGLADPALLAQDIPELDLFDATDVPAEELKEHALAAEAAGLAVAGITNSGGASASCGSVGLILVTSGGFSGMQRRSGFSRSVSLVGGDGTGMQRDYDFDSRIYYDDLEMPETIGRNAAERTIARLNPGKLATGHYPIVFDPRVARGLIGHLLSAINGASIARGSSFLKDSMGQPVLPENISIEDNPLLLRRWGSRPFDGEGVAAQPLQLVEGGVLKTWLLDSATGKELGLATNGRAARGGGGVSPSSSNVLLTPGQETPADLLARAEGGIYITELIGHGADIVTGDYSRGASGYRIRNGQLAEPLAEFTIAGHLRAMLASIQPADDADSRFSVVCPTLGLGEMTVAGG